MQNINIIKIEDNKIEKTFTINKLKALPLLLFTSKLLKINATDSENIKFIKMYLDNAIQNGNKAVIDDEKISKEIEKVDFIAIIFELIKEKLSENIDFELLNAIFNSITLNNGAINIDLNVTPNSEKNIDNYISDLSTIYKLIKEVIKINYQSFFYHPTEKNL